MRGRAGAELGYVVVVSSEGREGGGGRVPLAPATGLGSSGVEGREEREERGSESLGSISWWRESVWWLLKGQEMLVRVMNNIRGTTTAS